MTRPLIVIGAGGHAKVLIEALLRSGMPLAGIVDADPARHGTTLLDQPIRGGDELILAHAPAEVLLVNGLGSIADPSLRIRIFETFKGHGYRFETVIHPSAIVASDALFGEGVQVMAGTVMQPGCRLGDNSIINTGATLDHDCLIGKHVHIAPGVTLSGGVTVGEGAHIGTGATVIQGITIGPKAVVGAGAVVIRDVAANSTVSGVPAKVHAL